MAPNETAAPGQGRPLHIVNAPPDSSGTAPKRNGAKRFAKVPQEMKDQKRWCVWNRYASTKPGAKDRKFPVQVITDPKAWLTFEEAVAEYDKGMVSGIGYQMLGDPGVIGIDLDNCIDPVTKKANDFALQIGKALTGGYVESLAQREGHPHLRRRPPDPQGRGPDQADRGLLRRVRPLLDRHRGHHRVAHRGSAGP